MPASRESTIVRPLYDDEELFLQYHVDDAHSSAVVTKPNGLLWDDGCVELFAAFEPDRRPHYVNFEANCVAPSTSGSGRTATTGR